MLVGRDHELGAVHEALRRGRMVVLTGPPGIGKTTVAREALGRRGPAAESGALATLRWRPLLLFRRLLGADPPTDPHLAAATVLRDVPGPLLLDDLQWADDASLAVIAALAGRRPIVGTVRTGDEASDRAIEALGLVGAEVIPLGPLPDAAAAELAATTHPGLEAGGIEELVALAAGNPLLIRELADAPGPPRTSLVSALLERRRRLDPAGRTALERLAVLGRPVEPAVLGSGADQLFTTGMVVAEAGTWRLRHALLGEVVAEELGPAIDDVRRQLVPLVSATEGAHLLAATGAAAEAARLATDAMAGLPDGHDLVRAQLLGLVVRGTPGPDVARRFELARLLVRLRRPEEAIEVAAGASGDLTLVERGTLDVAAAEATWALGRQSEAVALLERAVDALRGSGTAAEVLALIGSTFFTLAGTIDLPTMLERAREAVAVAEAVGEAELLARWRLAALLQVADVAGWEARIDEVIADARAAGDDELEHLAIVTTLLHHWTAGRTGLASERADHELRRRPDPDPSFSTLILASYAALLGLLAGRPPAAVLAEHRHRLDEAPWFPAQPYLIAALAIALSEDGRAAEARRLLARAPGPADPGAAALGAWAHAEVAWSAGRRDEVAGARAAVAAAGADAHPAGVHVRLLDAHAAVADGRPVLGDRPAPWPALLAGAPREWDGLRAWSEGRPADAAAALVEAAEAWRPVDVRSALRCRLAAGEAFAAAGDREAALEHLRRAERDAGTRGDRPAVARAGRALRRLGERRTAPTAPGLGGLTAREVEVLRLVGAGLRTNDIAATLGVAPSTVESVVRSARRRFGAPNRLAAVAALRRLEGGEVVTR